MTGGWLPVGTAICDLIKRVEKVAIVSYMDEKKIHILVVIDGWLIEILLNRLDSIVLKKSQFNVFLNVSLIVFKS